MSWLREIVFKIYNLQIAFKKHAHYKTLVKCVYGMKAFFRIYSLHVYCTHLLKSENKYSLYSHTCKIYKRLLWRIMHEHYCIEILHLVINVSFYPNHIIKNSYSEFYKSRLLT